MSAVVLRPYQIECLDAVETSLGKGVDKQLIVLPTGAGKTVCFSQIPQRVPGRMLVLAHREELLTQAAEKISWANPTLRIEIEQGQNHATADADVVIASVPTLGRESSVRIEKFPPDHFTSIVVDEAHHAAAQTYRRVLDYFNPVLRLGVTATPQRGDKTRLLDIFDDIVYFRTIQDMIKEGYLVDMAGYRIPTDVDISGVSSTNGDYAIGELAAAVNVESRNKVAVEAYLRIASGLQAVVFCADVAHAYALADAFTRAGVPTGTVVGTTPNDERKETFARFAAGELKVLTNVNVATEGWDEPGVECVIFARPTKSPVMYTQAVGRGLRLKKGKQRCLVIDLADVTKGKKPVGLPTLMGLPPEFDAEGEDMLEVVEKYQELEEASPTEAARVTSVKDIAEAWEKIDLFTPPPPNPELLEYTSMVWMETGNDKYVLNLAEGERLTITGDVLGRYAVDFKHATGTYRLGGEGFTVDSMEEAFRRTDAWVKLNRDSQLKLLDVDAQWRKEPPSAAQLKILKKHGVPWTATMTKGQASQIIDKLFKDNPRPQRPAWLERKIEANKRGW